MREPHGSEHAASVARVATRARMPRTLGEYMAWMRERWNDEMPTEMHAGGVFRGWPDPPGREMPDSARLWARDTPAGELSGGSLLGSPRDKDPFRRLMECSPFEVEYATLDGHVQVDAHYVRPMRAALARMSHHRPMIAHLLWALACCDFDWEGLAARRALHNELMEFALLEACRQLWLGFDEVPRPRPIESA